MNSPGSTTQNQISDQLRVDNEKSRKLGTQHSETHHVLQSNQPPGSGVSCQLNPWLFCVFEITSRNGVPKFLHHSQAQPRSALKHVRQSGVVQRELCWSARTGCPTTRGTRNCFTVPATCKQKMRFLQRKLVKSGKSAVKMPQSALLDILRT